MQGCMKTSLFFNLNGVKSVNSALDCFYLFQCFKRNNKSQQKDPCLTLKMMAHPAFHRQTNTAVIASWRLKLPKQQSLTGKVCLLLLYFLLSLFLHDVSGEEGEIPEAMTASALFLGSQRLKRWSTYKVERGTVWARISGIRLVYEVNSRNIHIHIRLLGSKSHSFVIFG